MFDLQRFKALFFHLYLVFNENSVELNALDSAVGDGDHGSTMLRGFTAAAKAADEDYSSIADLFEAVSNTLAEQTGGAIGPLLAAFFSAGTTAFAGKSEVGLKEVTAFFHQGYDLVQAVGGAVPGDKTLLDALEPAVRVLEEHPDATLAGGLDLAAIAAEEGAMKTKEMVASEGRARFLGERALAHADPGATSFALLVKAFTDVADGLNEGFPAALAAPVQTEFHPTGALINSPETMVHEDNQGLALAYPNLVRLTENDVLVRANPKSAGKVGLAIGQGGGHTPSMGGFIGSGLLDADVYGPLFTCASGLKIEKAISAADTGAGVALLVSNHAGDVLNARLAQQRAQERGHQVEFILSTDDVATAPREDYLRRRGLGGLLFPLKVGGGAAEAGLGLGDVARLMRETNARTVTLGVASRAPRHPVTGEVLFELPEGEVEVGTGVHGEVGVYRGDLMPADDLVRLVLEKLVADLEGLLTEKVYVFLNGSGGTSQMELHILFKSVYEQLTAQGLRIADAVIGSYFTTLGMGGFSLSLCALPDEAISFWNAPANSPAFHWPH
jgi:dihydroxyacetone kinase phosphoprotein-dependent L subunit